MTFNEQIGELIKEYRLKNKLSIKELQILSGLTASNFLYEVERGDKGVSLQTFLRIKKALRADKNFEDRLKKICTS